MITHDLMEAVRLADTVEAMAGDPGHIAYRAALSPVALQRDDAYVHRTTAELLQVPAVRAAFGLAAPSIPTASASSAALVGVENVGTTRSHKRKGFSC
jgi:NitT/TauT family transport system ATP-binding protein